MAEKKMFILREELCFFAVDVELLLSLFSLFLTLVPFVSTLYETMCVYAWS